jgi:putative nucleotidyltransferase with HDIG domain
MRLQFIDEAKEGLILGKSIFAREGQILLKAGVELTDVYINKLRKLGVFFIYVEDERLDDVQVEDEKLTQLKQTAMKSMSSIFLNVASGNTIELERSTNDVKKMIDYILEIGDVNKSIYDIQTYDNYTFVHSIDTCIMAVFLGKTAKVNRKDLETLGIGAVLHDVGKIRVPIEILNKTEKLTDEEFKEIKKHPVYGVELLKNNYSIPDSIIKIVGQHHERIDGRGYPLGIKGPQITKFAKIVCICDVYDAVSNDRCYRKKFSLNDAYELILSGSGSSFDRDLVEDFKNTFSIYPLGCHVKLSNNRDGYVVGQNKGFPDRPIVRCFNKNDSMYSEIDLLKNTNIVISNIM